jgi:hypothetical protein
MVWVGWMMAVTTSRAAPGHPGPEATSRSPWLDRVAVAVAALAVLASLGSTLTGARAFHGTSVINAFEPFRSEAGPDAPVRAGLGDTVDVILPSRASFASQVRDGTVPLWNPLVIGGTPHAAIPNHGTFHVFNLPFVLLPLIAAPAYAKLLELVAALALTFAFARRLGLSRAAALLGGVVFAFSGFQVALTNWAHPQAAALVPGMFWATEWYMQERRRAALAILALLVAGSLLAGFPAVTVFGLTATGAYALTRVLRSSPGLRHQAESLAALAGAVLLGVGISALQLLPFVPWLASLDTSDRERALGATLPPEWLLTSVVPDAFGSFADGTFFGSMHYAEGQSFVGGAALVLAVVGLAVRGRDLPRGTRGFLGGGIVVMTVLVYHGGILLALLQRIPPFDTNPVGRSRVVLAFFLAVAAATGWDRLERLEAQHRRRVAAAVLGGTVLAAAVVVTAVLGARSDHMARYVATRSLPAVLAVGAVFILAVVRFAGRRAVTVTVAAALVLPVVAFESVVFARSYWPVTEARYFYPATPTHAWLADALGPDRFVSTDRAMYENTTAVYGLRGTTGRGFHDPRWAELLREVDADVFHRSPTWSSFSDAAELLHGAPIIDRLGGRFLVTTTEELLAEPDPTASVRGATAAAGALRWDVVAGPLRGVEVVLADPLTAAGPRPRLRVTLAARGDVIVGERGTRSGFGAESVRIPLAGEDLPPGSDLEIRLEGLDLDGTLAVAVNEDGEVPLVPLRPADDGLRLVATDGALVYERTTAAPRIRWATDAVVIEDEAERLRVLGEGTLTADTVVLEASVAGGPQAAGEAARLVLLEDGPDAIRVAVDADGPGFLVIGDAMQRGWRATVDDESAPLLAADHAGVAVAVPDGASEVRFVYRPEGLLPGRLVTAFGLASVGVLLLLDRRRRRPSAASPAESPGG